MAKQLPTPSPTPSPPPAISTPTLPSQINEATRKQHTILNRMIIDRLPLALPPKANKPDLLGFGIAVFAQIFYVFEDAWSGLIESYRHDADTHDAQLRRWLAIMRPDGLPRSARLESDLKVISRRSDVHNFPSIPLQRKMVDRMRTEIRAKPHTLVAYGWVFYMAIFSGGRWVRQQLATAGTEFWVDQGHAVAIKEGETAPLDLPGFSFLSFDGEADGEDIKGLFKARLAKAETLLSDKEKHDVILAAQGLFADCIQSVEMLDHAIWRQKMWKKIQVLTLLSIAVLVLSLLVSRHSIKFKS